MTIWKYRLETTDLQIIDIPRGATFLSVQVQERFGPCMWALVNEESPKFGHRIRIFGTGHPMDSIGGYVGTYQLSGGALVFHVFVERPK